MEKGFKKRFNKGDIVYWCSFDHTGKYYVKWGMVDEQFSDAVCIDLLEVFERRCINDIPIDKFEDDKYHKLPKGWTYNTELYQLTYVVPDKYKGYKVDITSPESIKQAYTDGFLVKSDTIFHGDIDTDITKQGYKIVKKYPYYMNCETHTSIRSDKVFFTYAEAKKEADANNAEIIRIANLSDYDWSVEQIDNTLNMWQKICGATDEEKQKYRDWILKLKNIENVEVRDSCGNIEWKYCDKKKWHGITLTD